MGHTKKIFKKKKKKQFETLVMGFGYLRSRKAHRRSEYFCFICFKPVWGLLLELSFWSCVSVSAAAEPSKQNLTREYPETGKNKKNLNLKPKTVKKTFLIKTLKQEKQIFEIFITDKTLAGSYANLHQGNERPFCVWGGGCIWPKRGKMLIPTDTKVWVPLHPWKVKEMELTDTMFKIKPEQ